MMARLFQYKLAAVYIVPLARIQTSTSILRCVIPVVCRINQM